MDSQKHSVTSFLVAYWDELTGLQPISFQWIFFLSLPAGLLTGGAWSLLVGGRAKLPR